MPTETQTEFRSRLSRAYRTQRLRAALGAARLRRDRNEVARLEQAIREAEGGSLTGDGSLRP